MCRQRVSSFLCHFGLDFYLLVLESFSKFFSDLNIQKLLIAIDLF